MCSPARCSSSPPRSGTSSSRSSSATSASRTWARCCPATAGCWTGSTRCCPRRSSPGRRWACSSSGRHPRVPSPNIWRWPEVYAQENAAQDVEGAVWAALRDAAPWTGRDVRRRRLWRRLPPALLRRRPRRCSVWSPTPRWWNAHRPTGCRWWRGTPRGSRWPTRRSTSSTPAPRTSSARAANPGWPRRGGCCGPAARSRSSISTPPLRPYGEWMRADIPHYDPVAAERFFTPTGLLAAADPDALALPRPRDLRGRAAHRVLIRRGRPRARAVHRIDDPGRLPAARAAQAAHP